MDLVVAHDLKQGGDDALKAALLLSSEEGGLSVAVVHVVTQQDLDQTGRLATDEKRQAAIEGLYPVLWKRVGEAIDALRLSEPEMDVFVRIAPVHLVESQRRIGRELAQVAVDQGAKRIVLGRTGRPGSVSEWLLERCNVSARPPQGTAHSLVLELDPTRLDVEATGTFRATRGGS